MNEFVSAASKDAPQEQVSARELAIRFLNGGNGSYNGAYHSIDNVLYHRKEPIARRTESGGVLLPKNNIEDLELNDSIVGLLFSNAVPFRRIDDFSSLTNPASRIDDLKNSRFDDFRAVAQLFGFDVSDEDIAAIERAREFKSKVEKFFTQLQREEEERVKTAEERERDERIRLAAIPWDAGEGTARNDTIEGSGGGIRLRPRKKQDRGYSWLETNNGHKITVRQAKKAWDFATKFWHGNEKFNYSGEAYHRVSSGSYYNSGRSATVSASKLKVGCQHVTRKEAERIADVMGWARAKK